MTEKTNKDYSKKFYEKNKDIEIQCKICAGTYRYYNKSRHVKSKKHVQIKAILDTNPKI